MRRSHRTTIVAALVAVLSMLLGSIAIADIIYNDVDLTIDATVETLNMTVGGAAATVVLAVDQTNGDGKNGCNLQGAELYTADVASSNDAVATVTPGTVTFGSCGDLQELTITALSEGEATVSLTEDVNETDATWSLAEATFKVIVGPEVNANEAPVITVPDDLTVEGDTTGGADVTYSGISANDAEDGDLTGAVTCAPVNGSFFTLGGPHTVSCIVTDSGGLTDQGLFTVTVVDTTKPVLTVPGDIIEEATGPNGAIVNYAAVTTADIVDAAPSLSCVSSPTSGLASGSTFPLGTTTITCDSSDASGNAADQKSYSVTVEDTTAPTLIGMPGNQIATATSASGAGVSYTNPTATDLVDTSVMPECSPASGSTFPVGTTTVTCTATDDSGNQASGSFTVSVTYAFTGFFAPVDNLPTRNTVKAGRAVPIKFRLGGDMGLDIFGGAGSLYPNAAKQPFSTSMACGPSPLDALETTLTAGGSSLQYDASTQTYIYVWKTDAAWAGKCRTFELNLNDGSSHVITFTIMK